MIDFTREVMEEDELAYAKELHDDWERLWGERIPLIFVKGKGYKDPNNVMATQE